MTASEVVQAFHGVAWSALGFALGYFVGRMGREVHQVREAVVTHPQEQPWPPMRRKGDRRALVLGSALVLMAALTLITSAVALARLESSVRCQAAYSEQAAEATQARTKAAEEDRQALETLIRDVTGAVGASDDPAVRRELVRQGLEAYRDQVAEANLRRTATPFPEPPSEVCR